MKKFEFSQLNVKKFGFSQQNVTKFTGQTFYDVYKGAEFLRSSENVEMILARGYELRQSLKEMGPGETIVFEKMCLERNTPLLVKNTFGANVPVEDFEFTYNRLSGLVAAYVFENRHRFPAIKSSEAIMLGLAWKSEDIEACRLYLSAVSGTEVFPQFSFYPLICALRKLQLKKISLPQVLKIAKIKNNDDVRMATVLINNNTKANEMWTLFGVQQNLEDMLSELPSELKDVFFKRRSDV